MKNHSLCTGVITIIFLLTAQFIFAQEWKYETKTDTVDGKVVRYVNGSPMAYEKSKEYKAAKIKELEQEHNLYVQKQKLQLKRQIRSMEKAYKEAMECEDCTDRIPELSKELEESKLTAAAAVAQRIDAHRKMTDGKIAFWKVRDSYTREGSFKFDVEKGLELTFENSKRKYKKEIRTTSSLTFGSGYNFMVGDQLDIDDFSYRNNEYFGIGYLWQTAISPNYKWRVNYGILYQSHGSELNGDRIFTPNTSETQIGVFGRSDKRKFRQDQLVLPFQLEFGGVNKREYEDGRVRYEQYQKFKGGIGAYVGINLSTRLKLKYDAAGRDIKQTLVNAFDTNLLTYGVDAYVGYDNFVLFGRASLSPVFKSGSVDAQYVSFGIRIQ
ncbi:MAG: hypothetical protein WBA16_11560 [Nonlabens sp.]